MNQEQQSSAVNFPFLANIHDFLVSMSPEPEPEHRRQRAKTAVAAVAALRNRREAMLRAAFPEGGHRDAKVNDEASNVDERGDKWG